MAPRWSIFGTNIRHAAGILDRSQRDKEIYHRSFEIPFDGQVVYQDLLKGVGKYSQIRNPTIKEPDGSIGSGNYVGLGYPEDGNPMPDDSWSMAHNCSVLPQPQAGRSLAVLLIGFW